MKTPKLSTRAGFTIAEVMVAAIVMAFAITTSITTMQRAFLAIDTARNLTLAGQIMVSEMERTRMLNWTDVSAFALSPTETTLTLDTVFTNNPQIGSRFTLKRVVTLPDASNTNIRQITLTITWSGYDGRTHSRSYTTHYARFGIHDYLYNTT
jgi:hypothetical protein